MALPDQGLSLKAAPRPFEQGCPAPGSGQPPPCCLHKVTGSKSAFASPPGRGKQLNSRLPCLPGHPQSDLVSATGQLPGFLPAWALHFLQQHLLLKYRFWAPPQTYGMGFPGSRAQESVCLKSSPGHSDAPWSVRTTALGHRWSFWCEPPKLISLGDQATLEPELLGRREKPACQPVSQFPCSFPKLCLWVLRLDRGLTVATDHFEVILQGKRRKETVGPPLDPFNVQYYFLQDQLSSPRLLPLPLWS